MKNLNKLKMNDSWYSHTNVIQNNSHVKLQDAKVNNCIWEIVHYNFTKNHIHHQIIFMELKVNTLSHSQSGRHNAKLNSTGIYSFAKY